MRKGEYYCWWWSIRHSSSIDICCPRSSAVTKHNSWLTLTQVSYYKTLSPSPQRLWTLILIILKRFHCFKPIFGIKWRKISESWQILLFIYIYVVLLVRLPCNLNKEYRRIFFLLCHVLESDYTCSIWRIHITALIDDRINRLSILKFL